MRELEKEVAGPWTTFLRWMDEHPAFVVPQFLTISHVSPRRVGQTGAQQVDSCNPSSLDQKTHHAAKESQLTPLVCVHSCSSCPPRVSVTLFLT